MVANTALLHESLPTIGITVGDPSGIGPEIVEEALRSPIEGVVLEVLGDRTPRIPGKPDKKGTLCAIDALEIAATRANKGELAAIVTAPVNKEQLYKAGFIFPGQTEFFATRAGIKNFAMLLTGGPLTVALVTAHIPLCKVVSMLSTAEIVRVGGLLSNFLLKRGIASPRVAVAGINPHAGDGGHLGDEEARIILPAISLMKRENLKTIFSGPFSPDTIFWRAANGEFDGVLCMYHDQGLIPLKLLAFHQGVNVTLGLPFVRTSPDHGTAYEIAGTGKASAESFLAAIHLAAELVIREKRRNFHKT